MTKFYLFLGRYLTVVLLLSSFVAWSQKTVTGKVTSADDGSGLPGVNIVVKGSGTGTATDADGNFSIAASDGAVLVFSFVGYTSQEITVGAQTTVNVSLQSDVTALSEVVVIGYGSVKKSDLTGSVATVGERELNKGLVLAPDQLMQGKAAGVQLINNSGMPGGATTVRIRGNASIRTGNQPLFVVDGVQLTGISSKPGTSTGDLGSTAGSNPLNFINPSDILSIQILKDASATAIYGSRGANGVVIITTKKGAAGSMKLDFNAQIGVSSVFRKYDVLDADEYRDALTEYGLTTGDYGDDADAFDEITRSGAIQNYNISMSGGSSSNSYRVSLGYFDQEGIVKSNALQRINANISTNFNFLPGDRLSIGFNLIATNSKDDGPPVSTNAGFRGSLIGNALQWNPTHALYNPDGTPIIIPAFGNFTNPVALLDAYSDQTKSTDLIASITPSFKLTDKLIYKFNYNVSAGTGSRRAQLDAFINIQNVENRGLAAFNEKKFSNQTLTHTLNFNDNIANGVNLQAVLGYEYQRRQEDEVGLSAQDFIVDQGEDYTHFFQNSSQSSRNIYSSAPPISKLNSYFARGIVNLNDKYIVTATIRADGSSKFGKNNQYGYFPSVGVAWNLHNESFFSGLPFNDFKFRLGWGTTGNSEFDPGAAQERWGFSQGSIVLENVANPDLKWETSTTFNAGFDFSILESKLSTTIDYYYKKTTDLLFQQTVIAPGPASLYWINLDGEVINSGLELTLNYQIIDQTDLRWDVSANISFLNNELKNYEGANLEYGTLFGQGISGANIHRLASGQPLNAFYLAEFDEIESSGGTTVLKNGGQRAYVGNPNQKSVLGLTTNVEYKRFSLNLSFIGAFGHDIYNNTLNTVVPIGNLGSRNIAASLLEGSVQESTANPIAPSSRYLEKGDYLKMNNATLSYNLGPIGNVIQNSRVYVTGTNLFVITDYTGFDPEVNTVNSTNGLPSYGIEYIPYPSARTFMLGVSVSF